MDLINSRIRPRRRRIPRGRLHSYPFGAGLRGCQWASPGRFGGGGEQTEGGGSGDGARRRRGLPGEGVVDHGTELGKARRLVPVASRMVAGRRGELRLQWVAAELGRRGGAALHRRSRRGVSSYSRG